MKHYQLLFLAVITLLMVNLSAFSQSAIQIGRYSTITNHPTKAQVNPLLAVSNFHFPPSIKTVGKAARMVLDSTGYRLADNKQLSESVRETLQKPLPLTNRQLGPLPVKEILLVLMGEEVYTLVCDPLHRIVNFNVKSNIATALGVEHGRHQNRHG